MKLKTILQFIVFFGLAIFMMWFATKDVALVDIKKALANGNKTYIAMVCMVGVLSIVFRAIRWQILIEPLGKKPRFSNTFLSIFIGYGVNFFTPRLGELARCGILSKYEDIPTDKLAGTMIAERLFDVICLLLLIATTLITEYTTVMDYFLTLVNDKLGKNGLPILGLVLLVGSITVFVVVKKILQSKTENKFTLIIKNLVEGVMSVFKMKNRVQFIIQTILIWGCYWAMTYLGFLALQQTSHLNLGAGFSVLTFGSLGFLFPFGGAGAYQLIVSNVLTQLYKIPSTYSTIYGLVSWALQNGILLVGAFIAFITFPIINSKK
jgi:glycosyltransferase 2 family protein